MRELRTDALEIETPLEPADGVRLADEVVIVAILRAGLGLVDGFLRLVPDARVGHLGMYRDEEALRPIGYYENVPPGVEDAEVFVRRPDARHRRQRDAGDRPAQARGRARLHFICLVAAPEGVQALREAHPEVPIVTAALDRELDGNGYIRPGLGDAGDRIFGTDR